jgi:HEAT repeat protein
MIERGQKRKDGPHFFQPPVRLCAWSLNIIVLLAVTGCGPSRPQGSVDLRPPKQAPNPPPPAPKQLDPALRDRAVRELQSDADSDIPDLRSNAIEGLQKTDPVDAAPVVLAAMNDSDPVVEFSACVAAGELRLQAAHDLLAKMHDDKAVPMSVQVGVRFALHRLGDRRYSHDLEWMARSSDANVRGKTALVLGLLNEPSAVVILRPMRRDEQQAVRLQAAESLWLLGNEDGLDDLLAAAVSAYPDDLILATVALAKPHNPRVIQHVRANLVADYPEVELSAARALGMLGSDEGYAVAAKGAASTDRMQRSLAALALGDIGRPDAQPILENLLDDPEPSVRLSAATAVLQLWHGK